MKILLADYIYIDGNYTEKMAIAFDKKILAIGKPISLKKLYPKAEVIKTQANSIIYPGFINTHVHLEFSSNKTTLEYGNFMRWLDSVIRNRDSLLEQCNETIMSKACNDMLRSGITTFGATSSYGFELEVCKKAKQKVTFFNELIGSSALTADILYNDFIQRVENSKQCKTQEKITPAIAIHSPYSTHPILIEKAVRLAKKNKYPISAHLLESKHEREWLESNSGSFLEFFEKFFQTNKSVSSVDEFMHQFDNYPTHFIHCTETSKDEKAYLASQGHSIAHCPRSNRLLGTQKLAIEDINNTMSIATDGLSSNWSLSIWDELRSVLMLHHQAPIEKLANRCIKAITSDAAKSIRSDAGVLAKDKPADISIVTLPSKCENIEQLSLQAILHTQEVNMVFIDGELS